jgi:hypothetical protein
LRDIACNSRCSPSLPSRPREQACTPVDALRGSEGRFAVIAGLVPIDHVAPSFDRSNEPPNKTGDPKVAR